MSLFSGAAERRPEFTCGLAFGSCLSESTNYHHFMSFYNWRHPRPRERVGLERKGLMHTGLCTEKRRLAEEVISCLESYRESLKAVSSTVNLSDESDRSSQILKDLQSARKLVLNHIAEHRC